MRLALAVLAQDLSLEELSTQSRILHSVPQTLVVLGVLLGVCLLAFVWVAFVRKPRHRRKRRHHHRRGNAAVAAVQPAAPATEGESEDQRKRRRREHRPRNPTLAETRGLPPVRESGTFPPST